MAMAPPLPTAASICLNHGQERLQNPLCLPRFRRIRSPLKSACGELQTSEPTTVMIASTSIRMHRVTVHVRERGVAREFLVPEVILISGFALALSPMSIGPIFLGSGPIHTTHGGVAEHNPPLCLQDQ